MAAFAVNLQLFLSHPSAMFSFMVGIGMQESHFLSHLVRIEDLEPKANNCTKVCFHHLNKKPIKFLLYNYRFD